MKSPNAKIPFKETVSTDLQVICPKISKKSLHHEIRTNSGTLCCGSYICCYLLMLFIVQRFNFFKKICLICLYEDFLSSQITKNSIIFKLPLPHVLIWPLTYIYFNTGCQIVVCMYLIFLSTVFALYILLCSHCKLRHRINY